MKALNIGSGQRCFAAPWVNVDIQIRLPDQVPDVQADGFQLPFKTACCNYVCLHHVLEHFGCNEALGMVRECWRVLEPGGSLFVFVPDLPALCRGYLERRLDDFLLCVNLYGAYQGSEHDRHRWGFSTNSLCQLLYEAAPWTVINSANDRAVPGTDVARDWWILEMEAVK